MNKNQKYRADHEFPQSIEEWGWKYHHMGIPTSQSLPHEKYLPELKFYVSGFSTCPFGIEWMRFEPGSPVHDLIQKVPHIAFVVNDLDWELENRGFRVLSQPGSPSGGIRVAMIEYNGAPVELMEFKK